ncbi:signal peptide peptidase SppA [Mycolicibacterium sp.]|uniref:signal peptide peptidase SppA n=1 Tax=Mycolicibacterium sp. TaxID=2320850 RepID=UPI0025D0FF3B|nr:signal peptide peptidase SppA [Mycolicibacterium sp.]
MIGRAFLPGVGDDLRGVGRRIDTARHHGIPNGCILEFDIQSLPPETTGFDPMAFIAGGGRPLLLRQAIAAIHRAAEDPRITGLIARVQLSAAPPGAVQELREALAAFAAVKPSLAWAETYPGTLSYYLASAFGEVWMQPSGTVGLIGFASNALFLRDALEKAGIQAQFVARGEYKSMANTFTEDHYTDAHREADSRLIESLHSQVWQGIAESRRLSTAVLDELADRAPLLRDDALAAGLIDRIGFRDEAYRRIGELTDAATNPDDPDGDDAPPRLFLSRYAQTRENRPSLRKKNPALALVTVSGPIVSGRGGPGLSPFGRSSAGGDTIAAALREAGADDDVKAVVLRIDSPGGSVNASETIWREVARIRSAGKPVVASMGAVAASGGYYIAMAADAIVANPATITGSIGVVTGKLVARELKDRLGVGSDVVRTNANADAWSANSPFTDTQYDMVRAEADLFYDDFVRRVAEAREMSVADVELAARGRVWTGADALERRLVDELGGLRTAVRRAKALAGLDVDAQVRLVGYPGSSVLDFLRPRASSQPAAASLPDAAAGLMRGVAGGVIANSERTLTGATALWLGDWRF